MTVRRICPECQGEFRVKWESDVNKYCSRGCRYASRVVSNAPPFEPPPLDYRFLAMFLTRGLDEGPWQQRWTR